MTSKTTILALLMGTVIVGVSGSPVLAQKKAATVQCMTDDGYGRLRSCSQGYKAANPNWRTTDSCFTDDGYGRKRSCSQGYKAKHAK